jgi:tetratricopeptide (TPR) repeat protein
MRVLVLVPTTGSLNRVLRIEAYPGLAHSFAVAQGDFQPLRITRKYADLTREGGPLAALARPVQPGTYRLWLAEAIDDGDSWVLPVLLAHLVVAFGDQLVDEPDDADIVLWSTGAVNLDSQIIDTDYKLNDKVKHSRTGLAAAATAGVRIIAILPACADAVPACTMLREMLQDIGARDARVEIANSALAARRTLEQALGRSAGIGPPEVRPAETLSAEPARHGGTASPPAPVISLPYPSLGSLFKGRDAVLRELHASLSRGAGRTAITGSALYGLGGIGKTRAAVEYAWAHQEAYTALLFVIAETPEALRRNLAALAGPLVLNLPQQHAAEEEVRVRAVLDELRAHPGWLLILDNLDTPEAVREADRLLSTLTGGRAVITSRLANFAAHFDPLALDVLGIDDAVAFLLERTGKRRHRTADDAATARLLAEDLGRLALALEQAAAFIDQRQISFSRYRELWRENWDKVAGWSDERLTNYPHAVAVTWQTSVDQLTPAGRRLLQRLAWFAPEPVPAFLLEVPVPDVESEDPADALAALAEYSFARRNPDKQEFSIHRLVLDVTRRGLGQEERRRRLVEALAWLNDAFAGDPKDVRTWPRLDPLAPHAQVIVGHADDAEISEPTGRLMNALGLLTQSKARYDDAEPLCRRALAIAERSCGPDHPNVAARLNDLASLLQDTNRLSEAEPLYRRALAIDETSHGSDHPDVARDLNNLAGLLWATRRLSEAEPMYRRALAIDERSCGPDHPNVAIRLNNLALLLQATNRLSEAEPMYRRALAIDEKSYGPDHPNVARELNNLAELLRATNRLGEAEPMYRRALAIHEKSYGADHPSVAAGLNNLAELLRTSNGLSEAEPMYRRAIAIGEKSYGPNHPNIATSLNNLALLLEDTNRLSEAEPLYRRALAIDEKSYGPDHPDVARDLNNLAGLLEATNRLSEAEPMYRRALAIDEKSYGPDHPNVAIHLNNLAQLLRAADRLSEAEPMYRRGLVIFARFTRMTGHRHPSLDKVLSNYARALGESGRSQAEIDAAIAAIWEAAPDPSA